MTGRTTISSMSAPMTTASATRASRRSYPRQAEEAVRETRGRVITYQGEICDARYSKACGGITEDFDTAWDDKRVPYLGSISDASVPHPPIGTEEEASALDPFGARGLLQHKRRTLFSKKSFPTLTVRQKTFSAGGSNIPGRSWKRSCEKNRGLISGLCRKSYPFAVVLRDGSPG